MQEIVKKQTGDLSFCYQNTEGRNPTFSNGKRGMQAIVGNKVQQIILQVTVILKDGAGKHPGIQCGSSRHSIKPLFLLRCDNYLAITRLINLYDFTKCNF